MDCQLNKQLGIAHSESQNVRKSRHNRLINRQHWHCKPKQIKPELGLESPSPAVMF